jgi:hypothetical protein
MEGQTSANRKQNILSHQRNWKKRSGVPGHRAKHPIIPQGKKVEASLDNEQNILSYPKEKKGQASLDKDLITVTCTLVVRATPGQQSIRCSGQHHNLVTTTTGPSLPCMRIPAIRPSVHLSLTVSTRVVRRTMRLWPVCLSGRPSARPSVCLSIRPSVHHSPSPRWS